jgi:hypothetical protein
LFSYWINTYTGGALAAIGGALVLGAVPRIRHAFRTRDFFWMALGMAILANTRPYEGLLVCVPALTAVFWRTAREPHPPVSTLVTRMAAAVMLLLLTVGFLAYYNHRVFGNVLTLPYQVNRSTYASVPYFLWQSPRPEPAYRHKVMRDFYSKWERSVFLRSRTASGYLNISVQKIAQSTLFFLGIALLPPLIMLPRALRDRRIRLLVIIGALFTAGLSMEAFLIPHYIAPFTAGLFAILLQCMRHLRFAGRCRTSGLFLVRATPIVCLVLATVSTFSSAFGITISGVGLTQTEGRPRARVLARLQSYPGRQLAIVRYAPDHNPLWEWVYNSADIDASKVVWARDMDSINNLELLAYFKDRSAWLVEPDVDPPRVSPYPRSEPAPRGNKLASEYTSLRAPDANRRPCGVHKESER